MQSLSGVWLDVLGWAGSALLVYSLLQKNVLRLRLLNGLACVALIVFNAMLGVWPMAGMNAMLLAINAWFIVSMQRDRHDASAFEVLEVNPRDAYLEYVMRHHADDIHRFNPSFVGTLDEWVYAYLIQKADETVGVVLLQVDDGVAHVLLDYVTQRYRDFSPGEFVWRSDGPLARHGVRRVVTPPGMVDAYYGRLGFVRSGDSWSMELTS